MQGRVKLFFPEKNFGFIWTEAGDWFFHGSAVLGDRIRSGEQVEFWLDDDPRGRGLIAIDVRPLRAEQPA